MDGSRQTAATVVHFRVLLEAKQENNVLYN